MGEAGGRLDAVTAAGHQPVSGRLPGGPQPRAEGGGPAGCAVKEETDARYASVRAMRMCSMHAWLARSAALASPAAMARAIASCGM